MFNIMPFRRNNLCRSDYAVDDFFNSFFEWDNDNYKGKLMKTDVKENDNEYTLESEIPGADKKEIKLSYKDDVLTISYEKEDSKNEEKDNFLRKERKFSSYSRSFYIENIDGSKINAKYENGVLKVTLPKDKEKKEENKLIDIN